MAIHKKVKVIVGIDPIDSNAKSFRMEEVRGKVKLIAVFDLKPDVEVESTISLGEVLIIYFMKNNATRDYPGPGLKFVNKVFGGNQIKLTFLVPSIKDYIPVCLAAEDYKDAMLAIFERK